MNTPSSALSDEMKGAMSTLLNAVIFEQWLRFSWIEEDEEGDFCIQIPAETVSELVEDYPEYEGLIAQLNGTIVDADMACSAVLGYARSSLGEQSLAVLDGVYPVSDGKHSRLRLRQGNASLYAVWFGMRPEQLPYATGDVVDTALNLSVYDAPRGAQLSGRIIDLHPAGLGSAMPQQAALVQALRRGTPLTTEQKNLITPARSDIIAVYRELQARRWHAEDLQPLCAKLGEENTGKTLVAVIALEQVGLIAAAEKGGAKVWELVPTAGKKNLADAPILKCLEGM